MLKVELDERTVTELYDYAMESVRHLTPESPLHRFWNDVATACLAALAP